MPKNNYTFDQVESICKSLVSSMITQNDTNSTILTKQLTKKIFKSVTFDFYYLPLVVRDIQNVSKIINCTTTPVTNLDLIDNYDFLELIDINGVNVFHISEITDNLSGNIKSLIPIVVDITNYLVELMSCLIDEDLDEKYYLILLPVSTLGETLHTNEIIEKAEITDLDNNDIESMLLYLCENYCTNVLKKDQISSFKTLFFNKILYENYIQTLTNRINKPKESKHAIVNFAKALLLPPKKTSKEIILANVKSDLKKALHSQTILSDSLIRLINITYF